MMLLKRAPSHSWWFDSHNSPRYSPWLQSALSELDEKTQAMLKLIEEDADSFAQRAEMFYKKRPELVNMVEDFYRAHRSLAERYDQLRSEAGLRIALTPAVSPFSAKQSQKSITPPYDRISRASTDCFETEDSEVDDPEEEAEVEGAAEYEVSSEDGEVNELRQEVESMVSSEDGEVNELRQEVESMVSSQDGEVNKLRQEVESMVSSEDGEVNKLRQEVERLKLENRIRKAELLERNEEKREAIRQLCLAMDVLKEENASLRKCLKDKKKSVFEFSKWKEVFSGKFFNGNPKL